MRDFRHFLGEIAEKQLSLFCCVPPEARKGFAQSEVYLLSSFLPSAADARYSIYDMPGGRHRMPWPSSPLGLH